MAMIDLLNCIAQLLINNFALFAYWYCKRCCLETLDASLNRRLRGAEHWGEERRHDVNVAVILRRAKF